MGRQGRSDCFVGLSRIYLQNLLPIELKSESFQSGLLRRPI